MGQSIDATSNQWVPIGRVRSGRSRPIDDDWDLVPAEIVLDPTVLSPDALAGLTEFSHIEVVYVFDQVDPASVHRGSRRPRGNPHWPLVGILAQRAKDRPNRIGISRCRVVSVDGYRIQVRDLDAVDGTPVLDIKPWMAEFGPRGPVAQPEWSRQLMSGYWSSGQPEETRRATATSYDRVAARYAREMAAELVAKPLDRALIQAVAELAGPGPALDAGSGPGQVAAYLGTVGLDAIACDIAPAMCIEARAAGTASVAGDLTALPIRTGLLSALCSFYAVIHLDRDDRLIAYREFSRVLRPGGYAVVAFHTSDVDHAAGGAVTRHEWWGESVDLTFRFLDPDRELAALSAAGLEFVGHLDRAPGPGPEHPSRRSYLVVRRVLSP